MEEILYRFQYDKERVYFVEPIELTKVGITYTPFRVIIEDIMTAVVFFRNNGIDTSAVEEFMAMSGMEAI